MRFNETLDEAKEREITNEEAQILFESANDWSKISQLLSTASYVRDKNLGRFFKLDAFILSSNKGCKTDPSCRYCGQASQKFKFFTKVATPMEVAESAKIAEQIGFKGVQCGGGCSGYKGAEAVENTKIVKDFYLKNFKNLSTIYISGFFPIPGTPIEGYPPATSIDIAKTMAITRFAHPYADLDGSFGRDDQLQLWIMAGTNRRIIHGIFESKNKIAFSRHFYGEPKQIGEDFIFLNTLPIYANVIKEMGLKPDLNQSGDKK